MVAVTHTPERLTLPLPLAGAIAGGGLVALVFLLMPASLLERGVSASGIPAVLAAAEPPLGITARVALGIVFGGLTAAFAWVGLHLTANDKPMEYSSVMKWLKRGDVHPDGPPRPPLFAHRDLGTPFLEVHAGERATEPVVHAPPPLERDLPADLDLPLAAFDPAAILAVPMPAPEPVAALADPVEAKEPAALAPTRPQLIDPGDRFETFEMTPVRRAPAVEPTPRKTPPSLRVPPADSLRVLSLREDPAPVPPAPVVAPSTETTVHALLARLERGVAEREAKSATPPRAHSLSDTLGDLRRLATGAS